MPGSLTENGLTAYGNLSSYTRLQLRTPLPKNPAIPLTAND